MFHFFSFLQGFGVSLAMTRLNAVTELNIFSKWSRSPPPPLSPAYLSSSSSSFYKFQNTGQVKYTLSRLSGVSWFSKGQWTPVLMISFLLQLPFLRDFSITMPYGYIASLYGDVLVWIRGSPNRRRLKRWPSQITDSPQIVWHNIRKLVRWVSVKLKNKKEGESFYIVLKIYLCLLTSLIFIVTKALCYFYLRNHPYDQY